MPGQKGGGAGEAIAQGQRGNRELIPDPPAKYSAWGKHHSQHPHTVLKPPPGGRQMMGIYLPVVSRRGCSGWAPHRAAALPRRGAPRRRRRRQGGRHPSRRPASVFGCRGAAHGCSWRSRSEGTAGEGKGHGGLGASPTHSSLPLPGTLRRWVSPSPGSLGCTQALCL